MQIKENGIEKEQTMKISRRQFFKGLGATIGMVGLHRFFTGEIAYAQEKSPTKKGTITITWLGHGTFLFTSVKGRNILLDPWITTNP